MSNKLLTIELVPRTCWYSNLRSELSKKDWDIIRRNCYKKADYKCEICGGQGPNHPVECHEIWEFDDEARLQTLKGVIALCPACHQVKHFGYAQVKGKGEQAKKHLCKINGWSSLDADLYIEGAFEQWARRSNHEWRLNIDIVEQLLKE